jgi:hypothetical protein
MTTHKLRPRDVDYLVAAVRDAAEVWVLDPESAPFAGYELDRAIKSLDRLDKALDNGDRIVIPEITFGTLRRE